MACFSFPLASVFLYAQADCHVVIFREGVEFIVIVRNAVFRIHCALMNIATVGC